MKKTLVLFTIAMIFMYIAFAVDYFLATYWFKMPTKILAICLMLVHIVLLCLHLNAEARKPKEE